MQVTTTDAKQIAAIAKILGITDTPERLTVSCPKSGMARECACGCGGKTAGGTWVPGHDAKHKSALHELARAGNAAAIEELETRGWPQPVAKKAKAAPVPATEAA